MFRNLTLRPITKFVAVVALAMATIACAFLVTTYWRDTEANRTSAESYEGSLPVLSQPVEKSEITRAKDIAPQVRETAPVLSQPVEKSEITRATDLELQVRETARSSGMSVESVQEFGIHVAKMGAKWGMTDDLGTKIGIFAIEAQRDYTNRMSNQRGALDEGSFTASTPMEARMLIARNTVGFVESTTGVTLANLMRFEKDIGSLPASLKTALEDLRSGDPSRQLKVGILSNTASVANEMSKHTGLPQSSFAVALQDRSLARDFQEELIPYGMQYQMAYMGARNRGRIAGFGNLLIDLGATGDRFELGLSLLNAYQRGGDQRKGAAELRETMAQHAFGKSFDTLSSDHQQKIKNRVVGMQSAIGTMVDSTYEGGLKAFFAAPVQGQYRSSHGKTDSDDADRLLDRGTAKSARSTLNRLASTAENDRDNELDAMRTVSVRWVGSVARIAKQSGDRYDMIARCEGVRVRCVFNGKPNAKTVKLKQKTRVAVYGKVSGFETDPKHGSTIILSTDKVNRTRKDHS
ncbi:hypothetical protein B7486_13385 [cyanobacterium TDX16]|nr:hypothetical protein B7486_13385 [cyanobacterium TDX16]